MKALLLPFLFIALNAFGHGENKPGPHGGHIRMPGTFHTELVVEGNRARVYLLDMAFRNPTTENSTVSLTVHGASGDNAASCVPKADYFDCSLPAGPIKGLHVTATRKGRKGKGAHYSFPLTFIESSKAMPSGHAHHH